MKHNKIFAFLLAGVLSLASWAAAVPVLLTAAPSRLHLRLPVI